MMEFRPLSVKGIMCQECEINKAKEEVVLGRSARVIVPVCSSCIIRMLRVVDEAVYNIK